MQVETLQFGTFIRWAARQAMRTLPLLVFTLTARAQIEVKNPSGDVVLEIIAPTFSSSAVSYLFYYADEQPTSVTDVMRGIVFRARLRAKTDLVGFSIIGSVHMKDGSVITFKPKLFSGVGPYHFEDVPDDALIEKGQTREIVFVFDQSQLAGRSTLERLDAVSFVLQDPARASRLTEERAARLEQEETEREERAAADAVRRKRRAAEERKKLAEAEARTAAARAEEARRVRSVCAAIYRTTADKKLRDLTVKEEQQVRACQALNQYPPD